MKNTSQPRIRSRRYLALVLLIALFAAACSSSGDQASPGEAIETNEGGVLVKPPDVLEGDPAPTTAPLADIPPPVDGLNATPAADFVYFDGTPSSTASFAGRPTVVNFWASNCAACIAEMPEFEEVHQALLGQVDFVGMNVADVRESAIELAGVTGVTYPLADDTDSLVFRAFGGFVMPTTVLLNPQGQVAFAWSGVLTGEELRKLIDEHIAPGSNSDV